MHMPLCLCALIYFWEGDDENKETRDNESSIGAIELLAISESLRGLYPAAYAYSLDTLYHYGGTCSTHQSDTSIAQNVRRRRKHEVITMDIKEIGCDVVFCSA